MKRWNWLRILCLVGGGAAVVVGRVLPGAEFLTDPLAGYLFGVATRTPGHAPGITP